MQFRHIAIEGPPGIGKTSLARRLATRLDGHLVLENAENPFLPDVQTRRPGAALQAQLLFLLHRHRQHLELRQRDLFAQVTVCDYLFDRDRIFAYLYLDDNELFIYQRLYELLAGDIPSPDLVIYLQAPADLLLMRRDPREDDLSAVRAPDPDDLREIIEAYQHFFFQYTAGPLLVVETSEVDLAASDEAVDDLLRQIAAMGRGTQFYVPRIGRPG